MNKFCVFAIMLTLSVKYGFAIKCYSCDSTKMPGCADLSSDRAIVPEECTLNKVGKDTPQKISDITKMEMFPFPKVEAILQCQKMVVNITSTEQLTTRGCQLHGGSTNTCLDFTTRAKARGFVMDHCSLCDTDECNGSTHAAPILVALYILTSAIWLTKI